MSKLSRTVLKEIVKECIIEIFEESFFTQGSIINENSDKRTVKKNKRPRIKQQLNNQSHLDNVSYNQPNSVLKESQRFSKKVDNITATLTDDPIMADIFKDTASTTLQQQNASPGRSSGLIAGGDAAAMKASNSDPTELFAESAGKWAALAFADPVKR